MSERNCAAFLNTIALHVDLVTRMCAMESASSIEQVRIGLELSQATTLFHNAFLFCLNVRWSTLLVRIDLLSHYCSCNIGKSVAVMPRANAEHAHKGIRCRDELREQIEQKEKEEKRNERQVSIVG